MKARTLKDETIVFAGGRFKAEIKVFAVSKSSKFPDGVKVRCVLLDLDADVPRLLLDNHEPFGYHVHTKLPSDKNFRTTIEVVDYEDAIRTFIKEARKVIESAK